DLTRRKEELERDLSDRSEDFRRRRGRDAMTADSIGSALADKTVLIDFIVYAEYTRLTPEPKPLVRTESIAAFVVVNGRKPTLVQLGAAAPIEREVAAWREAVRDNNAAALGTASASLFRLVWKPLAPHLGDARTILTAPDGALCQLALAALPREGGGCL